MRVRHRPQQFARTRPRAGRLDRHYDPATGQFLTRDPIESVTREAYGYVYGNPLNYTDPSGLFTIPGTDWCVDIADPNCNSNADGESLADAPERIGAVVSPVKDWMEENSRIAHENSSIPGWARFTIKASTAYFTTTIVGAACAASAAGTVVTGGGSLVVCVGAIGLGYLSNATVGYVVDNNECLSWEGWARNLSPDKALGSWLQWPPW